MKTQINKNLFTTIFLIIGILVFTTFQTAESVFSQSDKLSLRQILRAIASVKTKITTFDRIIKDVKTKKVDFPLYNETETLLRNEGATNELINVIRQNSLPLKGKPSKGKPPAIIKVVSTPTPSRQTSSLPDKLTINLPNAVNMEFVKIPAGSFMMGSGDAERKEALRFALQYQSTLTLDKYNVEKQHKATIDRDFYIGKYEVTQVQWKAVMGKDNNPSILFIGDNLPVENVNWNAAKVFIDKLKIDGYEFRLPNEAEWEYACRAGTTTAFSFGDSLSSTQANFNGNYPYNATKGKFRTYAKAILTDGDFSC
jgi:formylglycine-generating enzyme required for sulfatase activity